MRDCISRVRHQSFTSTVSSTTEARRGQPSSWAHIWSSARRPRDQHIRRRTGRETRLERLESLGFIGTETVGSAMQTDSGIRADVARLGAALRTCQPDHVRPAIRRSNPTSASWPRSTISRSTTHETTPSQPRVPPRPDNGWSRSRRIRFGGGRPSGGAVGWVHPPPARLGTLRPGRGHRTRDGAEHCRPRRVAGCGGRLDEQHCSVQPVQHTPHDRCHGGKTPRRNLVERIPRLPNMGGGLRRNSGHAPSAQHVGDHGRAASRERDTAGRIPRCRGPECVVRALTRWRPVLRGRHEEFTGQPGARSPDVFCSGRVRERKRRPAVLRAIRHQSDRRRG